MCKQFEKEMPYGFNTPAPKQSCLRFDSMMGAISAVKKEECKPNYVACIHIEGSRNGITVGSAFFVYDKATIPNSNQLASIVPQCNLPGFTCKIYQD